LSSGDWREILNKDRKRHTAQADALFGRAMRACSIIFFVAVAASTQRQFQEDILETSGGDLKITCIGHGTLMFTQGGKVVHAG
jgi:hypothetical protein